MGEGIGIFVDALGINSAELVAQAVVAVQGTLILFFVLAPLMGTVLARFIASRANAALATSLVILLVLLGNLFFNLVLRSLFTEDVLPAWAVGFISFLLSLLLAYGGARAALWALADPGKPRWMIEDENLPDDAKSVLDKRREQAIARRKKHRGR